MFQQKTQLTALSPFGLGGFGHDSTATAERSGSGVMATPDTNINVRNNIAEALAETMAATIVESLRRMEAAESSSTLVQPVAPSNVVPVQATPAAAQSPLPAQSSLDEKLKALKKLRDSGIITQEETDRLILRAVEMN